VFSSRPHDTRCHTARRSPHADRPPAPRTLCFAAPVLVFFPGPMTPAVTPLAGHLTPPGSALLLQTTVICQLHSFPIRTTDDCRWLFLIWCLTAAGRPPAGSSPPAKSKISALYNYKTSTDLAGMVRPCSGRMSQPQVAVHIPYTTPPSHSTSHVLLPHPHLPTSNGPNGFNLSCI
jgi:hypothetical protein